ncbi:MAG TPA: histidine phosphatase family protein [Fluviicola sp.]|nr:histidine phosphatase family protein [Fluviicola sp.]
MLTLHIIRHAKTNQQSATGKDKDRELLEKGIAQSNLLGHYLQSHHIELGTILCSSATRTRQTKSIICQHLAEQCCVEYRDNLYMASQSGLLEELASEKAPVITIIGHNDGLSDLASYCADEYIGLKTCEFITMTFPFDDWSHIIRGTGTILLRYRPDVFLPQ